MNHKTTRGIAIAALVIALGCWVRGCVHTRIMDRMVDQCPHTTKDK